MLLKALLCVVEENAKTAGRTRTKEERTVKSIIEVRTRIDARKGRNIHEAL
jgi:hypothetical protein